MRVLEALETVGEEEMLRKLEASIIEGSVPNCHHGAQCRPQGAASYTQQSHAPPLIPTSPRLTQSVRPELASPEKPHSIFLIFCRQRAPSKALPAAAPTPYSGSRLVRRAAATRARRPSRPTTRCRRRLSSSSALYAQRCSRRAATTTRPSPVHSVLMIHITT